MNAISNLREAMIVITFGLVLVQASCAPPPQVPPTQTTIVDTATPLATSTPEVTSTPTETQLPPATFTPSATAIQLPAVSPAAEGRSNVIGLVLWNDRPVAKTAVWLCKDWLPVEGCVGRQSANTDRNGYYVFYNVPPDKYIIAMNSFSTIWYIFYFDAGGNREQNVSADEDLILDPWSIYKLDLRVTHPENGKVISEARPTFKWNTYPDAAYYQIFIFDEKNRAVADERVSGNEYTPELPLVTCGYTWYVEAYNSRGTVISLSAPPNKQSAFMGFSVIDVPGNC